MKLITAIIRPHKLDDVKQSLSDEGVFGMTVTEVQGYGRQKGHTSIYRGAEYVVDLLPKVRIEIACETQFVERITEIISTSCKTGSVGDGKIFVQSLDQVIRIRTSETDNEAL